MKVSETKIEKTGKSFRRSINSFFESNFRKVQPGIKEEYDLISLQMAINLEEDAINHGFHPQYQLDRQGKISRVSDLTYCPSSMFLGKETIKSQFGHLLNNNEEIEVKSIGGGVNKSPYTTEQIKQMSDASKGCILFNKTTGKVGISRSLNLSNDRTYLRYKAYTFNKKHEVSSTDWDMDKTLCAENFMSLVVLLKDNQIFIPNLRQLRDSINELVSELNK